LNLICKYKNGKEKIYDITKLSIQQILETVELENIESTRITERYVCLNRKDILDLISLMDLLSKYSSVDMHLFEINDFVIEISLNGKLSDVIGIVELIIVHKRFRPYYDWIKYDAEFIKHVLRRVRITNISRYSISPLINFISRENGGMNWDRVIDILELHLSKTDSRQILCSVFEKIYGMSYLEALKKYSDKFSENSIDEDLLKELKSHVQYRVRMV